MIKGTKMSKPTGLTSLAITSKKEDLAAAKAVVVAIRKEVADLRRARKEARINIRAEKKAARIAKLEAKLISLKTGPVGIKALKANRKPSKVTVTKVA